MTIQEILKDPATSYWLRDALTALLERDPVDALHDIEILQKVFVDLLDLPGQWTWSYAYGDSAVHRISEGGGHS